jgi:GT2 family glycosyltransferase
MARILVSAVSHRQGALVRELLSDLDEHCSDDDIHVVVTINVSEDLIAGAEEFGFPLSLIENTERKGFAANHNAAFHSEPSDLFCVVNPDVRLTQSPFPVLLETLQDPGVGIAAPLVVDGMNVVQDSARRLPTPLSMMRRKLGPARGLDYEIESECISPDFVAGIFMLIPSHLFSLVGGLDERYFLYFEDIDLCARLRLQGYEISLNPSVTVVHDAQRTSRRDLRYLKWHLTSMSRFFLSRTFYASLMQRRGAANP